MKIKKIFISILFISTLLLSAGFVFAQRDLEVPLPNIGGETGISKTPFLPDYIKYIFNFAVWISGLIAFGCVIYGGVRYLTSGGNPSAMGDAKDRIFAGLLGVVVILSSWLLLNTINPQLLVINPQAKPSGLTASTAPGVYLCNSQGGCMYTASSLASLEKGYEDEITSIKFINFPGSDNQYGAVLHEATGYGWTCDVFTSDQTIRPKGSNKIFPGDGVSSITVFSRSSNPDCSGVTIFEDSDYRGEGINVPIYGQSSLGDFGEKARSIAVNGNCLVLLFRGTDYQNVCEVTTRDIPSLKIHPVTCTSSLFSPNFDCLSGIDTVSSLKIIPQ